MTTTSRAVCGNRIMGQPAPPAPAITGKPALNLVADELRQLGFCRLSSSHLSSYFVLGAGSPFRLRVSDHKRIYPTYSILHDVLVTEVRDRAHARAIAEAAAMRFCAELRERLRPDGKAVFARPLPRD